MKAVLLVGGLGTRLRTVVPAMPKALATVGGRPFLELLVKQLRSQGIHELVMCTGYMAEQIESVFGRGDSLGVTIEYSRETACLGTAGALGLAQHYLQDEPEFLMLNGDSLLQVNFHELIDFHHKRGALATMAVVPVENSGRYGTVLLGADGQIRGFAEKTGLTVPGIINAGVYVFDRAVLKRIPEAPASLERDVLPRLLGDKIFAIVQRGLFIDIGIPDDYMRANQISDRLANAAC